MTECPVCRYKFCSKCTDNTQTLVKWHEGRTCSEFKAGLPAGSDAYAEWARANNIKPCPKCGNGVHKHGGCRHMTCTVKTCRHQFCWLCGSDYRGPNRIGCSSYNCKKYSMTKRAFKDNEEKLGKDVQVRIPHPQYDFDVREDGKIEGLPSEETQHKYKVRLYDDDETIAYVVPGNVQ